MSRRVWRNFDFVLLSCAVLLTGIGIAMIHSATHDPGSQTPLWEDYVFRQAVYAVIGLLLMGAVAAIDCRFYHDSAYLIYGLGLLLLMLVLAMGRILGGARSWFGLPTLLVQPSELAKIALIVVLARHLGDSREGSGRPAPLFTSLLYLALPAALVYLQPDMGTAFILGAIWLGMAWASGIAAWQFGLLGAGGLLAAPSVWFALKPYMRERIIAFLNRNYDPLGQGYNTGQALISIGSGGLWGKGFVQGTQSQLHFLRVRHTDYIFSVYAEELGFVGSVFLLALFLVMLLRTMRAAKLAQDSFGQLLACGVALMIFSQSSVNLAVNLGLLPTTGLPLPFISAGGSSLLTMFLGVGLVESVVIRHKKLDFE